MGPKNTEFSKISQNNSHYAIQVTSFGINGKPIYNFLCVQ